MKLGMLIPEFPTQTHIFFWREIEALRKLGHEVAILSTRRPSADCPHEFGRLAAPLTHYVYPPQPAAALRTLARGRGLGSAAAYVASLSPGSRRRALGFAVCAADLADFSRREGIDHIHVHSCALAAHVAALAQLLGGAPYSLHLHGDLRVYGSDHPQKMRGARFVAAAADAMRQQIVEGAGLPYARTCRMIMGVDLERFQPRRELGATQTLHMVSISRLAECKGHRFGLEALRRALDQGADIRYSIAGDGPDRPLIEADIARLQLQSRVSFVGPLGEAGVVALLQTADLFLLTSSGPGEASPVAVMEAMASGVPAVCSIIGGTPDMIKHGEDGILVAQENVEQIALALLELFADRARLGRLGAAARARAEREFSAAMLAQQLVDTIERFAETRSAEHEHGKVPRTETDWRAGRRPT